MRTNLAERLGVEPEEVTEERQRRIWEAYQMRKAMRRLARLGCCWLSGVAFALCIIAGCVHAADETAALFWAAKHWGYSFKRPEYHQTASVAKLGYQPDNRMGAMV